MDELRVYHNALMAELTEKEGQVTKRISDLEEGSVEKKLQLREARVLRTVIGAHKRAASAAGLAES